jgi:CubicO group peptidase (beta-lactamase class C family)
MQRSISEKECHMQRSNGYLKGILKSGLLLVLSLSLFMDCDLGRPPARVQGPGERLAAINQPYIIQAIEDNNIPGISIAVVDAAQVIWLESFGVSSLESGQSNNPDRLHRLGPLSQTFVSFALHKLENEGALSLSDSLAEFFPETVETYLENITLKQILSHSSGIVGAQMLSLEPDPLIYRQALDYALRFPPDFPAGERFAFSSTGIEILGMVIEKVTGQDFSLYMDAEVLPPLGMAGGGFNLEGKTIIPGHNHGRSFEEYSHSLPIAGMVGSLNQLSDFLIKLSDISYGAGTSPWNKDDIDSIRDYRNGDLLWPTGAFIGLGSGILGHKIRSTGPVLGMEGGTFGSSAAFYYLPEEDMGIVYLSNNAGA